MSGITNTILQLARFNSTNTPNNAEWTTSLREACVLNEGDTLSVRQAFIDSRLNSSTNIVISEDTNLSLTYYFYVMFPCDVNSWQQDDVLQAQTNATDPTTQRRTQTARYAATDFVAMAGPNGFYSSTTGAPNTPGQPGSYPPTQTRLQQPINTWETARGQPQPPATYGSGVVPVITLPPRINQCCAQEIPMLLITNDLGGGDAPPLNGKGLPMAQKPITRTWNYTLKAGSYSPAELADLLTKNMAAIQTDKITPSVTPYQLFGGANPTNLNSFLIKGTGIASDIGFTLDPTPNPTAVFPDSFIGTNRYNDLIAEWGNLQYSSNSVDFSSNPVHSGVFTNFLTDTPFNTDYMEDRYFAYYGIFNNPQVGPEQNPNPFNLALQHSNPIIYTPAHYSGGYGSMNEGIVDSQATAQGNWYREYASSVVGSTEISLEYNPETEVFQWTYLHTPILEQPLTAGTSSTDASEPIEVVKIVKSVNIAINNNFWNNDEFSNKAFGEVKVCEQTRHSGVFFQSMEPASFWQDIMGFDVPNITFDASYVWGVDRKMTFQEFNKITTSGYVGIENNFNTTMNNTAGSTTNPVVVVNKNAPAYLAPIPCNALDINNKPIVNFVYTYSELMNSDEWIMEHYVLKNDAIYSLGIPNVVFYYDYGAIAGVQSDFYEEYSSALTATNPLQAIQIPLSQTNGSGHYFVEIVGYNNNTNDFVNDNSIYAIKSIVAAYYVSPNSFITQPFADTAVYEHIGDTVYLNKFKVRLLDPLNMKQAAPLGPNSSVYLQLGRQINKDSMKQPI